jgi:transcriptional regulator with XRE-family HTH domain
MAKKSFVFTKEMAGILRKVRERAGLSQAEVAERIGLSSKTKDSYISHLEKGRLKNPALGLILLYLRACGASWVEFFKELDAIDFKMRHAKMMAQVQPPPTKRKIERDAMRYEIGVEMTSKEKEEIDFTRLKKQIKDKVTTLVNKEEITLASILSHPGRGEKEKASAEVTTISHSERSEKSRLADYQKFALEYFDFLAELNKAGMKMVVEKYQRAGLKFHLLFKIKKVINSILRGEIKRLEAKKPLPLEKQEKMAIGFTKYRIKIEQIEAIVHKLLCEFGEKPPWFVLYKDFAREYFKRWKQYYNKPVLNAKLAEIVQRWVKEGLKEEILLRMGKAIEKLFEKI